MGEEAVGIGCQRIRMSCPRRFRVSAEHGKQGCGKIGVSPSRCGKERCIQSGLTNQPAEMLHVIGIPGHLVFNLDPEEGKTAHLIGNRLKIAADIGNIRLFSRAQDGAAFFFQPVGEAAVSAFAVRPRTDAETEFQPGFMAEFNKCADIPVSGEVELSLFFFMVNPEYIGCRHVQTAVLHFLQGFRPSFAGNAAVVNLTHHGEPRFSVFQKHSVGDGNSLIPEAFQNCRGRRER